MKTLFAALLTLGLVSPNFAADWPQFFGPNRDGHSSEKGLLKTWPKGGPTLVWTFENAGIGYSSPAVVGDRIYLTGGREKKEWLFALDATTGRELWKLEIGPLFDIKPASQWGSGPRATPSVVAGRVYAMGGGGDLVCADVKTEKALWRVSMAKALKGEINPLIGGTPKIGWGYCWSPLVDGDKLIVYPGGPNGAVAALECATGEVAWQCKALTMQASYASPIAAEIAGVKQYIVFSNEGLHGVGTAGQLLWTYKRAKPYKDVVITTPLYHDGHVYCTAGMGSEGCDLVKITKVGDKFSAKKVFANKDMKNNQGGVVLVKGHIYGYSDSRGWMCQPFMGGEPLWEERDALNAGSVICADGNLYCYTEDEGIVALLEATNTKYVEKARFKIPKTTNLKAPSGRNWTPPVIANGHLFIRDQELLFCFKIK